MATEIKIRLATREDFESILAFSQKLFEYETKWGKTYNKDWTYSPIGRAYFAVRLERGIVIVAEADKKVVGYICGYIDSYAYRAVNPIAELENMYIDEKHRRSGVGTKMIKKFFQVLRNKKVPRVKVGAIGANEKAISFYKKNGFDVHEVVLERNI